MEWKKVSFGDVAEIVTGNTPPKKDPENYGGNIPWVKPPDLNDSEPIINTTETLSEIGQKKARLLPKDSVLVCCIGSIGRVGIAGTTLATNQQINSLIFKPLIDPKFGYYYCQYIKPVFESSATQAVVSILNKTNFSKIQIPLPPISEQRRIVEILDQADALRKQRIHANKVCDRILPALFLKMFGDPATNPMGWDVVELELVSNKITDGTHQSPEFVSKGIPFLFVQNIVNGYIDFNTQKYITQDTYDKLTKRVKPEKNDILYSTVGSYGVAVLVEEERQFSFQRHIGIIKPNSDKILSPFLCTQLNLPHVKVQVEQRVRGIAQKTLNLGELKQILVLCPPLEKQKSFNNKIIEINKNSTLAKNQSNLLEKLFNILLHRAFSGELTAKWREGHLKELLAEMEHQNKALNQQTELF